MGVITGYTIPAPTNPFKSAIDEMIDAGAGAAYELIVQPPAEGKRGSVATERVKFQNAARDAGHTARVVENTENADGSTRLVFVLTEKRERKAKVTADAAGGSAKASAKTGK